MVLKDQSSNWSRIEAGISLCTILESLFFFVYINELAEGLKTRAKLFEDDTLLFPIRHESVASLLSLNDDLLKNSIRTYQWKMILNSDALKPPHEIISYRQSSATKHELFILTMYQWLLKIFKGIYNPGQNIWNKMEKFSKTGQDKKSLISTFAQFLIATAKV